MKRPFVRKLLISLFTVALAATSGCGGGGGSDATLSHVGANGVGSGAVSQPARGAAVVSLRVAPGTPGASVLAAEPPSFWNPLVWISSPAFAQAFHTIPGARVDAVGHGFAFADSQGVARFFGLTPGLARFVVSSSNPGTVLQTLTQVVAGQTVNSTVDPFTTMAAITATYGAGALNTDPGGVDFEALVEQFESASASEFANARTLVESRLVGTATWLDLGTFLPSELEVQQAFAAINQQHTYRVQKVPLDGQAVPTDPIILSLTFNNPVDPATLPGLGAQGWSLTTPSGSVLDQSNFAAQGGSVSYSGASGSGGDGRAYPPNTLVFRLPGATVPAGTALRYRLALGSLPRDLSGQDVLSSSPASAFAEWNFVAYGAGLPGAQVESNVSGSLDFLASACNGSTNANLQNFAGPQLMLSHFDLGTFTFDYYEAPNVQRLLQLRLKASSPIQVGSTFAIDPATSDATLVYEERLASGNRRFRAESGTVTIVSIEDSTVVAVADVVMAPDMQDSTDAQGRFCLQTEMVATFP